MKNFCVIGNPVNHSLSPAIFKCIFQDFKIQGNLDVTDTIMNNTFWVGIHPALTEEMLGFTASVLTQILRK